MGQKFEIEVHLVQLLRRSGLDQLTITIHDAEMVSRICGKEVAEVWDNQICFTTSTAHGKGEKLAEELGLVIDEVIEVPKSEHKFSRG